MTVCTRIHYLDAGVLYAQVLLLHLQTYLVKDNDKIAGGE